MLISLALLLCQEPALRWSREVDDQFWQALHLLEVEERAEDAAATLAGLIEEPSVQQFRGQTGYLLAQQYRALRAASLHEEAEALLPSIRREVAGTGLASPVEEVLALADRAYLQQDGTDAQLIELLANATSDRAFLRSLLRGYGDRATPEILEILDSPGVHLPGSQLEGRRRLLWEEAWELDSAQFLNAMASRVQLRGWDYLVPFRLNTVHVMDLGDAQQDFLLKLSMHPDVRVFRYSVDALAPDAHRHERVLDRFSELVRENSELTPLVLNRVFLLAAHAQNPELQTVLRVALASDDPVLAASARAMALEYAEPRSLRYLADEKNDREAQRRLLAAFAPTGWYSGTMDPDNPNNRAFDDSLRELMNELGVERGGNRLREDGMFSGSEWGSWLRGLATHDDLKMRELVLAFAVGRGEFETVFEVLEQESIPPRWPLYIQTGDYASHPELLPHLIEAFSTEEGCARAWALVLHQGSGKGLAQLTAEDYLTARDRLGSDRVQIHHAGWVDPSDPKSESLARQRLLQLASSNAFETEERIELLLKYTERIPETTGDREMTDSALELLEVIPGWQHRRHAGSLLARLERLVVLDERDESTNGMLVRYARLRAQFELAQMQGTVGLPEVHWVRALLLATSEGQEEVLMELVGDPGYAHALCSNSNLAPYLLGSESILARTIEARGKRSTVEDWNLVQVFRHAMAPSADTVRSGLTGEDPSLRRELWKHVAREVGSGAIAREVLDEFALRSEESRHDPAVATDVVTFLARMGDESWEEAARTAWELDDLEDRKQLVRLIGLLYSPDLVSVLLDAQASALDGVSAAADVALDRYARIRDARTTWQTWERQGREGSPVDALIAKTASNQKQNIRIAAIRSLAALGATEALPFLVELLEDRDQEVVAAAQQALDRIHAAAAEEEGGD